MHFSTNGFSMDKKKFTLFHRWLRVFFRLRQMMFWNWMKSGLFVYRRKNKRWRWTALCRRTKQIVAFVIGDRCAKSCRRLWNKIPESYKRCQSFSDFWQAYATVFDTNTHEQVGKETGETAHMKRWNNTLRQRNGRYVRETLSFSKKDSWHHMVTKMFVVGYNQSCII